MKEPYQLVTVLYTIDDVSITVYDTFSFVEHDGMKKDVTERLHPDLTSCTWLKILQNLAKAVKYIHEKSIVHRDIKGNIVLLYRNDGTIDGVLVDFGKSDSSKRGKRYHLSPVEQEEYQKHKHIAPDLVDGTSVTSTASDIYSYGRLLKDILKYFPLCTDFFQSDFQRVIVQCMHKKDVNRPSIESVIDILTNIHHRNCTMV